MTKPPFAIDSLRDRRHAADHEVSVRRLDRATSTVLGDAMADAWVLAACCSILTYAMAESMVRSNAHVIAAITCALGPTDAGDSLAAKRVSPVEGFDSRFVEDLLASDRRSIACETFGGEFVSNSTMPLRRDLILASGVVC